ncbi:MAG: GatB/YqeY domain-containing protein, partial [Candidatus Hermodarchaeota archaeon]|nr:GatB/YqeY domain-containing protein [Candidatus Hermodarchaeota archaeon]
IILVAAGAQEAKEALEAVAQRAKDALQGVPEETRGPLEDGTTRYMRPRPGAARMYPETDVAPVPVEPERLERIKTELPELPEKKLKKFRKQFHLSEELAQIMIRSLRIDLFEEIAQKHSDLAVTIAATLETLWTNLEREGVAVDDIPEAQVVLLFTRLAEGRFAKEALENLLTWLGQHPASTVDEGLEALGLTTITRDELRTIVENLVAKNASMIKERGERAIGPLMGLVMKEVRGRADGKIVNDLLRAAIQTHITK